MLALALVGGCLALVIIKRAKARDERRHDAFRDQIRPAVLMAMDGDGPLPEYSGWRGEVVVDTTVGVLNQLRGIDRVRLARLLADRGLIDTAIDELSAPRAATRQRAAELLGATGLDDGIGELIKHLTDNDVDVRTSCARALGKIGAPWAVEPLLETLSARTIPANTVAMSIMRIGPAAAPSLITACDSESPRVRAVAAELLGEFGDLRAMPALERQLRDDHAEPAWRAARALGRIGHPDSTPHLVLLLTVTLTPNVGGQYLRRSDTETVAKSVITALGNIGNRQAIPILTSCLSLDYRISGAAAAALAQMGQRRSPTSVADRSRQSAAEPTDIVHRELSVP